MLLSLLTFDLKLLRDRVLWAYYKEYSPEFIFVIYYAGYFDLVKILLMSKVLSSGGRGVALLLIYILGGRSSTRSISSSLRK
jgi:hypothetical protein